MFSFSLLSSVEINVTFFNISICVVDHQVQTFYTIWCHIWFVWFFLYLDVIQIKIFNIYFVIKKLVRTIFYIDSYYPSHLCTNMVISMEYIYSANLYEHFIKHTSWRKWLISIWNIIFLTKIILDSIKYSSKYSLSGWNNDKYIFLLYFST